MNDKWKRKLLESNSFLLSLSVTAIIVGFLWGYFSSNFTWWARSGSIVVSLGILFIVRTAISGRPLMPHIITAESNKPYTSQEHWCFINESMPEAVKVNNSDERAISIWGPLITFLGTIIWGYGDLLNICFHFA
jgi:ribose/xylose/arabinose/galactoside ABC-type transport system permease subunit